MPLAVTGDLEAEPITSMSSKVDVKMKRKTNPKGLLLSSGTIDQTSLRREEERIRLWQADSSTLTLKWEKSN